MDHLNVDAEHYLKQARDSNVNAKAIDWTLFESESWRIEYAPMDYINRSAKLVILGLTPGAHQANVARAVWLDRIRSGNEMSAKADAKRTASFSGPMRNNLIALLDHVGLAKKLDLESCESVFERESNLCHFTSALRYPVFLNGKNYSGSPSPLRVPCLLDTIEKHLAEEVAAIPNALWLPLGTGAVSAITHLISRSVISHDSVLTGMPHPSGANSERIAYFLGNKDARELSLKTNAAKIDVAKKGLLEVVSKWDPLI